jgi:hypothetical protein
MFQAERIAGYDFEPIRLRDFIRPPFRKFEFSTPMSTEHAARVLQEIVEPPRKSGDGRLPSSADISRAGLQWALQNTPHHQLPEVIRTCNRRKLPARRLPNPGDSEDAVGVARSAHLDGY